MTLDKPRDLRRLKRLGSVLRPLGREFAPFDWAGVELTLPNETFEGELSVEVGERRVELIEVGPAHTAGDAIAWVPDASVCFAADVLFIGCTPITWAGPLAAWLAAIDRISALGATTFVPGHGPVCDRSAVDLLRQYLEWAQTEGGALLDRGVPPAKAARELLTSREFASFPWATWDDPARLVITLSTEQYRREAGQGHLTGSGRTRAILAMQWLKSKL